MQVERERERDMYENVKNKYEIRNSIVNNDYVKVTQMSAAWEINWF